VLAGDLGPEPARGRALRSSPQDAPVAPVAPVIVAAERPVSEWLKPVASKPGTFKTDGVGRDRDVELEPFYRVQHRTYAAYWDLATPSEYEKRIADLAAEREWQQRLERATVAYIAPGDQQAERAVNQQGDETTIVRADGRPGRRAGKWFSYELAVDPARPMTLVVTYNTDTRRTRTFEILVDDQRIGEQTIPESSESRFFDVEYRMPSELVRGKQKVRVRFQAATGNETAPVFGVRMIRRSE